MLKEHPRGIIPLFFIEMWERFGFYIMMAIFALFMESEFGWDDSRKGPLYGLFIFGSYIFPILGGFIGDMFLGQIRTITIGSISMLLGYIGLASSSLDDLYLFYGGLFLVAFGTGIFKVNMSVLVGNLYREKVELKDAGFNLYYMAVNMGATLAPLAATLISIVFHSYRVSFLAAAIGMSISLLILLFGQKPLHPADTRLSRRSDSPAADQKNIPVKMSRNETSQRIITLIILFAIIIIFWIAFYQNGFPMTMFAKRSTISSEILRPETYAFFNPFFILLLTPLLLTVFSKLRLRGKEPSTPAKIFYGLIIMGFSMIVMVIASLRGGDLDQNIMSPLWLISAYLVVTLAEILISPMGQSYVSKVSPPAIQGLMMGLWFGATAAGGFSSGMFGKFYSAMPHHQYFLILAALLFFAAFLILLSFKKLKRFGN